MNALMKALLTRMRGVFSAQQADAPPAAVEPDHVVRSEPVIDSSAKGTESATSVDEVERELRAYLAGKSRKHLSPDQVDAALNVWDVGYVDSLSYVEFLAFIENQYNVVIPDVQLTRRLNSVRALAGFICSETKRD